MASATTHPAHRYVRVVPENALEKAFDYSLPPALAGSVRLGSRLRVPWGKKEILAYAVDFPETPEVEKVRDVLEVVGDKPLLPQSLLRMAQWMANYYCSDLPTCLRTMLPEAVRAKADGHKQRLFVSIPGHVAAETAAAQLKRAPAQLKAWHEARLRGGGWMADLCRWTESTPATWRALEKRGLALLTREKVERNPFATAPAKSSHHTLNHEQAAALTAIHDELAAPTPKPILLQGITGSGKTELYLRILETVLNSGRTAIVLVPEISLTPQTVERFRSRFEPIPIAVLHSHLSPGERHDQWHRIHTGQARIVIGARSAVFAPLENLGLIVVDEEHEGSYKQEESPHYQARDLAVLRGHFEKALVLLGSATPSLESYHNALSGKYRHVRLTCRIDDSRLPVIHLVDLRKEKPQAGKRPLISSRLHDAITERTAAEQQSILYLNRRGFASSMQCPNCGHVEECPHCAVPVTYHRATSRLRCHLCDHHRAVPSRCPKCEFENYKYSGIGTQRIEEAVAESLGHLRWQRVDSDSMRGKHTLERILGAFERREIDVLIGTQMIAKGLDFPNVTCVGVVQCDTSINLPDFRAAERVFQQLIQVAGRAGRGKVKGEVYIQTYMPFHPVFSFARHHDVDGFLEQELEFRKTHGFPPFSRTALVTFRSKSENKATYCLEQAIRQLREVVPAGTEIPDGAPAPIPRIKDEFRFHLFLQTPAMSKLTPLLRKHVLEPKWPDDVRVTVDVDPLHLL